MPIDLFSKTSLPKELPEKMQEIVENLKESYSKEDCLGRAYEILAKKYRGYRAKTYTRIFEILKKDIDFLWGREGFLHCTNINYVLRTLLVESGFFKEEDIRLKWTHIWLISPHQYVQVKIKGEWMDVDVWAAAYGIKLGNHARGFR